jgi:type I restriction enzyme, S subunit
MTPSGWREATLGQLGELIRSRGGTKKDQVSSGIPVVRYGELYTRHHSIIRRFYSFILPENIPAYTELNVGDILFAGSGETAEEIGKSAAFLGPQPAFSGGDLVLLRPNHDLDSSFLGYATNGPSTNSQKRKAGHGSSVFHIHATELARISLLVPPLGEQRKIAAILSSVDDAIEATQAVIEQLQVVKKAMMAELLTRGLPGRHTRFKMTELGEIPADWEVVKLGEVAVVERGKFSHRPRNDPKFFDGLYPYIQTGDVAASGGRIRKYGQTLNEAGLSVSRVFPEGTIVITIAANIGDTGIAMFPVAFPDSLVGIQVGPKLDNRFTELVLRTRKKLLEASAPQNAQKNINLETLRPLVIQVPTIVEQREIANMLDGVEDRLTTEQAALQQTVAFKSALMAVLLTGEVRVRPDVGAA